MTSTALILGLVVLAIIIAIVLPMIHKRAEGFVVSDLSSGIELYDALNSDRPGYLDITKQNFNPLASVMNPRKINMANSDDPNTVTAMSHQIQDTMNSTTLVPNPDAGTYLGASVAVSQATLPYPNQIIAEAKKCQRLTGRDSCASLNNKSEYGKCGVCILKGTPYSDLDPNPHAGKWIGGLLVLPEDRKDAEAAAGPNREATYSATVGECPGGKLYVDADKCIKEANRLDCKEYGASGGFGTPSSAKDDTPITYTGEGVTVEGKVPKTCANAPAAGSDAYIYEPQGRGTSVNLRVAFPYGTGQHRIRVFDSNNLQVASHDTDQTSVLLTINGVTELNKYRVYIGMETPHMPRGKREAFIFNRALTANGGGYNQTKSSAAAVCSSIGARLATGNEAQDAFNNGAQSCTCAWTSTDNSFPSQSAVGGCGGVGINSCAGGESWGAGKHGMSWCFGVKPPKSKGDPQLNLNSTPLPWFTPYDNAKPDQTGQLELWSRYDGNDTYQAQYNRAFVAQWETTSNTSARRVVPFEPTIIGVNGSSPSSTAPDGLKSFSNFRRRGTFSGSSDITGPRPANVPQMLTNQFWMWSNQRGEASAYFDVQIPGIFLDSYYKEDRAMSKAGYLIGKPFSTTLLATSPCLAAGQVAGKFSIACLKSMFIGAGGDPYAGKLATKNGGLLQLNKIGNGSLDAISGYLSGLYDIIMTGKDKDGNPIGMQSNGVIHPKQARDIINNAGQLMFGFDMVSPCEYIYEDSAGNIVIGANPASGNGALDAECLDYLYMNTYTSSSRGNEATGVRSSIKSTYTDYPVSLASRSSGLRSDEGKKADRDNWPFQACQRTGTLSPLKPDGATVNTNAVRYVNSQAYPLTKSGYRMIDAVQMVYDSWHKAANYYTNNLANDSTGSDDAAIAVRMCYGIAKNGNTPQASDCGIKARYVRVMGSWINMISNTCLQIPQIEVFTTTNAEVAKGKPTSANTEYTRDHRSSVAVNGNNKPHSHYDGEFVGACDGNGGNTPSYSTWWMVDLGATYEIASVKFHPRTDCCAQRQYMCPVQLLNESKTVVAEKRIWDDLAESSIKWNEPFLMSFSGKGSKPYFNLLDTSKQTNTASYTLIKGHDRGGADIACFFDGRSSDFCKSKCDDDPNCKSYNTIRVNGGGCCYKTSATPVLPFPGGGVDLHVKENSGSISSLNVAFTMLNATTGKPYKLSLAAGGMNSPATMRNLGADETVISPNEITYATFILKPSVMNISGNISIGWNGFGAGGMMCAMPGSFMMIAGGAFTQAMMPYATFKVVPAINGDPAGYSLQGMANDTKNMYLVNHVNTLGNRVGMQTVNTSDPADARRAVWYLNEEMGGKGVKTGTPPYTGKPLYGNIGY